MVREAVGQRAQKALVRGTIRFLALALVQCSLIATARADREPARVAATDGPSATSNSVSTGVPAASKSNYVDVQVTPSVNENNIEEGGSFRASNLMFDGASKGTISGLAKPFYVDSSVHGSGTLLMTGLNYAADDNSVRKGEMLTMVGLRYKPTIDWAIEPWLTTRITGKFWLSQGYAESRLGNFVPPNQMSLYEAYVEAKPVSFFSIQVGSLNQAKLDDEILLGDSSFPGLLEKFMVGGDLLSAELRLEQAIPTATSLSTNTVDAEPMPSFFYESLVLDSKPTKGFEGRISASHFTYNDLPSVVAQTSETRGNSVNESGPNSTKFRYQFDGYVGGGDVRVDVHPRVALLGGGKYIINTQAPETYNQGQDAYFAVELKASPDVSVRTQANAFFLESDTAPAYWLESFYGAQTNRYGYAGSVEANFKKRKFSVGAHWLHYDPINPNQWQASENLIFLEMTAAHELF